MSQPNTGQYWLIRPFDVESDLPRLVRLLSVTESIDQSGEDISEETLRAQLTVPHHNPALDRWVIEHSIRTI